MHTTRPTLPPIEVAALFLPPAVEAGPDPADWLPNDKHRVVDFLSPDSPRALALAGAR